MGRRLSARGTQVTSTAPTLSVPRISVVVASKVGPPVLDACLESLADQVRRLDAEVLVVLPEDRTYAAEAAARFPWVRVLPEPEQRVPALRARGVDAARGELIAIIEEHCSAREDWLDQALMAHAAGCYAAVGGPIAHCNYPNLRDWVVYFCEYHGAMPPAAGGETENLNDANIAYRREVLLRERDLLDEGYWPMVLHGKLRAAGHRFCAAPEMVVYHRGPFGLRYYLGQRFLFSRAFAGVRARTKPPWWRLAYLLAAPLLPCLLLWRMVRAVRKSRQAVRPFVLATPLILIALVVLVAGEWVGCLFGPGDALAKVE